ncbi:ATP-binding protein [Bradyrhizobium sp. P5_C11_2]
MDEAGGRDGSLVHARRLRGGRKRVLTSLAFAAAIPVLLLSGWIAYFMAQQQRDVARHAAELSAMRAAERIASDIATQVEVLQALATSTSLDQLDLKSFYNEAERLKDRHPLWETVELSNPDGVQLINLLRPPDADLAPTADFRSFEEVLSTRQPVIGGIGPVGPISGKRLVALRVPVIRGNTVHYVLSVLLATNAVSSILRDAGAPADWIGAVADRYGNLVARTRAEASEIGRPASPSLRDAIARAPQGFYTGATLEGEEVEVVYRTLEGTGGWSVHFAIPLTALNAPVARSYFVLGGGSLASFVLAVGLAGLVARDMAHRRENENARMTLALRLSEEAGAVAVEAAELGTLRWDSESGHVTGSERARRLLSLPRSTRVGQELAWQTSDVLEKIVAAQQPRILAAIRECVEGNKPLDIEFQVLHPDRISHWVRVTGRVPKLSEGVPEGVIYGVVADIELRKHADAERSYLLLRLAEAQENEQRRIARELHDQVGQTVTGLSLGLKSMETLIDGDRPASEVRSHLHWLKTLAGEIGRDIHRAAVDLRPTALDDLGLREALQAFLNQWVERHGIRAELQSVGDGSRLPTEVETAIYRIVQEALTNILKHAEARSAIIAVEQRNAEVRVVIEDDGRGFDADAHNGSGVLAPRGAGQPKLGLSGMRERLSLLGGRLTVESAPGVGTALFICIPLPPVSS